MVTDRHSKLYEILTSYSPRSDYCGFVMEGWQQIRLSLSSFDPNGFLKLGDLKYGATYCIRQLDAAIHVKECVEAFDHANSASSVFASKVTESLRRVYDLKRPAHYCLLLMSGWQHRAAFVVQFRPETNIDAGRFEGRVEHVATNRAIRFHSLDELLGFIASVLTEVRDSEQPWNQGNQTG